VAARRDKARFLEFRATPVGLTENGKRQKLICETWQEHFLGSRLCVFHPLRTIREFPQRLAAGAQSRWLAARDDALRVESVSRRALSAPA
jgi:hypothetical protein